MTGGNMLPIHSEVIDRLESTSVTMNVPVLSNGDIPINVAVPSEFAGRVPLRFSSIDDDTFIIHRVDGRPINARVNVTPDGDEETKASRAFTNDAPHAIAIQYDREEGWCLSRETTAVVQDEVALQKFIATVAVRAHGAQNKHHEQANIFSLLSKPARAIGRLSLATIRRLPPNI